MPPTGKQADRNERVVDLVVNEGLNLRDAAKEAGVSSSTAHRIMHDMGYQPRPRVDWVPRKA